MDNQENFKKAENKVMRYLSMNVWEGVYNTFEEANEDTNAYDSNIWHQKQQKRITEGLEKYRNKCFTSKDYPLSVVVAMVLNRKRSVRLLDFGGGYALQYLEVISKVTEAENRMYYYVVDNKSSLDNRPRELDCFRMLHFSSNLNNIKGQMDIYILPLHTAWSTLKTCDKIIYTSQGKIIDGR